jgi:hypothetical protein
MGAWGNVLVRLLTDVLPLIILVALADKLGKIVCKRLQHDGCICCAIFFLIQLKKMHYKNMFVVLIVRRSEKRVGNRSAMLQVFVV